MANLRTLIIVFVGFSLIEVANSKSVNQTSSNPGKVVYSKSVNKTSTNPIKCPSNESGLCWPKCCFPNQVFSIDRLGCISANMSIILKTPEIFKIRYWSNEIAWLVCFYECKKKF